MYLRARLLDGCCCSVLKINLYCVIETVALCGRQEDRVFGWREGGWACGWKGRRGKKRGHIKSRTLHASTDGWHSENSPCVTSRREIRKGKLPLSFSVKFRMLITSKRRCDAPHLSLRRTLIIFPHLWLQEGLPSGPQGSESG
ncbi:hypothetical protein E2C01_011762 [Portunus trituberculatus]|uniref:Uncharacterized protein n=1 Tax=Portunus trituberculatus TaxID=210409 RepID=A0A5B7DBZ0_PORTR|nr:hypothetical protein [Portunus trituberculatus]